MIRNGACSAWKAVTPAVSQMALEIGRHRHHAAADVGEQLALGLRVGRLRVDGQLAGRVDLLGEARRPRCRTGAARSSRTRGRGWCRPPPEVSCGAAVVVVTTGHKPQRQRPAGGYRRQAPGPRASCHVLAPLSCWTTMSERPYRAPHLGSARPYPSGRGGCQHRHEVRPGMRNPACTVGSGPPPPPSRDGAGGVDDPGYVTYAAFHRQPVEGSASAHARRGGWPSSAAGGSCAAALSE